MTNTKKDATVYYGLIMATYSVGYVTMSAFSSLYLLDIGLSNGAVGILLAIASLISVMLQPPVGALIDRSPRVSTKSTLLFMGIVIAVIGLTIITVPGKSLAFTTVLYAVDITMLMLAQPFLNALGMDAINFGYPINFGVGRSMGSLGYAVGSFAFGRISVMAGPKSVPVAFSIAFLVLCVLLFLYPVKKDGSYIVSDDNDVKENPFLFLGKYRRFAIMLLGLIFVYFSHALINTFTLQIVMSKNGSSGDMGTATSLAAFCELITLLLFPIYMKHFKLDFLIRISCLFFVLKTFFSFVVSNMLSFYLIQGFQMFGWGLMSMGIVYYVNNLVGEHDKAQGQAYAGMAYTIASVLATFLGGNIIDIFGVNTMLLSGSAIALAGGIIVWFSIEKENNEGLHN